MNQLNKTDAEQVIMEDGTAFTPGDELSTQQPPEIDPAQIKKQRQIVIGLVIVAVVFVLLTLATTAYLMQPTTDTAKIRDIFIIYMGFWSMLLSLVLVILIIQLSRLINLMQNEVKPILDSTKETVSTVRGTTTFLTNNVVEPVIKMNEYMAGLTQLLFILRLTRRPPK